MCMRREWKEEEIENERKGEGGELEMEGGVKAPYYYLPTQGETACVHTDTLSQPTVYTKQNKTSNAFQPGTEEKGREGATS